MPENLTSRPPQTTYIALQLSWLQQKPSFDGIQAGNSTEWKKLAYNNINLAAGQLQIVTWSAWLVSLNDGEKESKTQLAPSAKVCSLASFSILTGYARLCLVIPRQTTSKQKELTLFTENGLPTVQMTNIKFF